MSRVRTVVTTELLLVLGLLAFVALAFFVERTIGLDAAVRLSPLTALLLAAIPAGLWLSYFYTQDRHEPEPKHYVLGVYLLGAFVAGPLAAFGIDMVAPTSTFSAHGVGRFDADRMVRVFLVIALAQELCKYIVVRYTIYLSPEFDEPMDGIIYMTAAGIGYATWENYHYFSTLEDTIFLATAAGYAVQTTLAHACFAGVLGYFLGRAKFSSRSTSMRSANLLLGLLVATVLNGLFSLVAAIVEVIGLDVQPWRGLAWAGGFAAIVFFIVSLLMRNLLAISPFRPGAGNPDEGKGEDQDEDQDEDQEDQDEKEDEEEHEEENEEEHEEEDEEEAPRWWQTQDALIAIAALAVLAAGGWAYRSLTAPELDTLDKMGLSLQRPVSGFTRGEVPSPPLRLGGDIVGRAEPRPSFVGDDETFPYHTVFTSSRSPLVRLEVRIDERPGYGNLRAALDFQRRNRWGEHYWADDAEQIALGDREWLRTEFRYAYKPRKDDTPLLAYGIEYATVNGSLLYTVTAHAGNEADSRELAGLVAPTLEVDSNYAGAGTWTGGLVPFQKRERKPPDSAALRSVLPSVVMVIGVDVVNDQLEPVSGGSGTIVARDGSVLTNHHILYDYERERLRDLFLIARFRHPDSAPELVCSGRPSRSKLDAELDLALVKCDVDMNGYDWTPENWPAVAIDTSITVVPSEKVWVIGYPDVGGGFVDVASGIVEGLTGAGGGRGEAFIRTNAPITHGNSGGAAVDEQGVFVGVPTAFRTRSAATRDGAIPLGTVGLIRPVSVTRHLIAVAREGWIPTEGDNDVSRDAGRDTPDEPRLEGVLVTSVVLDVANDRPVPGATVVVFQPGVGAGEIDMSNLDEQAVAVARTNAAGEFTLPRTLPRGSSYTVAVIAEGFSTLAKAGALVLGDDAPDHYNPWGIIRIARE